MANSTAIPLVCIPFAGAGASFYHAWSKLGIDGVSIQPLQLPGRERRIADEPFTNIHRAADALVPEVLALAKGESVAMFGHCFMGSVLAYEITRRLLERDPASVRHLFISASRTPAVHRNDAAAGLGDNEFLQMVKLVTGYVHPAFEIPEMLELLLPTLRADFEMDESYQPDGVHKLPVPITAAFATQDELALPEQVAQWHDYTAAAFELVQFEGGHMYLANDPLPLLRKVAAVLGKQQETLDETA